MKSIKLLKLKLVNFKGIKKFELNASCDDIGIFGDNGTGKTTLFDASEWLLFDKDSQNQKDFGIKTLRNGKVIHNLNHEVEGTFLIDGKELTLKKVFMEKWTKKKGSLNEKFTGHTTNYFVNGVPIKKKEYEETIKKIVEEDIFRLLTSPSFFNEKLHWKDRRNLLIEIAGEITDDDIFESDKSLSKLANVLSGRSIDDHKKVIAAKRREINQELERIPIRIDEIHRGLPDVSELNEEQLKADIDKVSLEIEAKNDEINNIKNGAQVSDLKKQIRDIDLQIANVRNEHSQNEQQELYKLKARLQEEQSNLTIMRGDLRGLEQQKNANNSLIKSYEEQMQNLRDEYIDSEKQYEEQFALEFDHENNCVCPTCEQELPEDQVDAAVTNFNRNKSQLLEKIKQRQIDINTKGKELKGKVEELQQDNESLEAKIDKITNQGKKKALEIEKIENQIKDAELNVTPIEKNETYMELNADKQQIEQQINQIEQSVEESIQSVKADIQKLKNEDHATLQADLNKLAQVKSSTDRIKQLEDEEKALADKYEELEHQLHLTELFTRKKVDMLTENINSKFKLARFNLFKENINGGLEETCETTYEGVPYSSGLNNAARINVGLDIINTLSEHYEVQAPIFVDNAESVTKLIDIDAQIISLVVSEEDKELRVEIKSKKESEVA